MKLVDFDQSNLLPEEKFHANGFELVDLKSTNNLNQLLKDLWQNKIKSGFSWEQKSETSFHLRPTVFEYDSEFVDLLFNENLTEKLYQLSGRAGLCLYHIQVVKTIPGPSYQDWHRDSYQHDDKPFVGAFPPAIKINYYPHFESLEPRLKFIRGSHRCQVNDVRFDNMLISKYDNEILNSSNERVLIFDSSMLHGVIPDINPNGSIRVMYSFALEHEYQKRFAIKENHRNLRELFDQKLWGNL